MKEKAIAKLDAEVKAFRGDRHGEAVYKAVAEAMKGFCAQDGEFAQAIAETDKTLSDCCKEIMQGVGASISDIEVYRRAAAFYFPGADIRVEMTIDLCAGATADEPKKPGRVQLDLMALLEL